MSSLPRRQNSTNPRPGSTNFPRMSMRSNPSDRPPLRSGTTASNRQTRPTPRPAPASTPRPAAPAPGRDDSGTKTQINQTLAIAMMTSPINPLPFPLPIPIGVTMLLSPSSGRRGSGNNASAGR